MKKTIIISSLILALLLLGGCGLLEQSGTGLTKDSEIDSAAGSPQSEQEKNVTGYTDISPEEAKKMIDDNPDLIVIDVSPNYAQGHLPRAINYYVGDGSLDKAIPGLNPEAEYLVYCHVDSAAILGAQKLVNAGFKNVYRLTGNYQAWVDAGYPVEK